MTTQDELHCFCENIKKIRKEKGLCCRAMAKKLQIGIGSLRKIEQGEVPPRLRCEILLIIYKEFEISPEQMFAPLPDCSEKNQKKQKNS
jgi:transcriptional regulator with XRE-family HTH domain